MRRTLCLLTLLLAACEPEPTALRFDHEPVVVHALLEAGSLQATVIIDRMRSGMTPTGGTAAVPVAGARVHLIKGTDTLLLSGAANVPACRRYYLSPGAAPQEGCYSAALPGGVQPGAEYRLQIRLSSGELITGQTTVPPLPALVAPPGVVEFEVPRLPASALTTPAVGFSWTGVAHGRRTELRVVPETTECGVTLRSLERDPLGRDVQFLGVRYVDVTGRTSALVAGYMIGCAPQVVFDRGPGRVMLSAYDANYTRYVEQFTDARPLEEAAVGITGAYGLFGAVATAVRAVEIIAR